MTIFTSRKKKESFTCHHFLVCNVKNIPHSKATFTPEESFFSEFENVSGFISFRVFGFVGDYNERIFGFLTVCTGVNSGNIYDGMVNKLFVPSTTRNRMPPKRRLGVD